MDLGPDSKARRRRTCIVVALCWLLGAVVLAGDTGGDPKRNHDPDCPKLVTSDLNNFWRAFALAASATDAAARELVYQREYLDNGSPGLRDFLRSRIESAHNLVREIEARPKYYSSLKEVTRRLPEMEPPMRASFRKLKDLYADAVFPDIYFLVGIMNSGGTTSDSGLLIGIDMYGKTPATDMTEMDGWLKAVLALTDVLPGIVAHELIHYQQSRGGKTLLGQSIHEGSADFVGELISGQNVNQQLRAYGDAHEADLWREFSQVMDKEDTSRWLYQGEKSIDRPADLGYYIGYRIAQSYYERAANKKQAIRDILRASDYPGFLRASHYGERFASQ